MKDSPAVWCSVCKEEKQIKEQKPWRERNVKDIQRKTSCTIKSNWRHPMYYPCKSVLNY